MQEVILLLIGGLGLFIFAVNRLSAVLRDSFESRVRLYIKKFTQNIISAIVIGTAVTILLDSSSVVIIMTIILVNAHVLSFKESMGIVMGANIGTTFSSQIIALDIGEYAVIPLALGLIIQYVTKKEKIHQFGQALLYFGLLFFGLYIMETAVAPLKQNEAFLNWLVNLDNPLRGAMLGGLITLIIQSSSATVGLVITLGKQNLIHIAGGIAVMLGAELGTCSDTLLATIGGTRPALKTGLFHLIFNFISIILGLILFSPFVRLVQFISVNQSIDHQIANAHMLFNILGVLLFLPFVLPIEKLLNKIIPTEKKVMHST